MPRDTLLARGRFQIAIKRCNITDDHGIVHLGNGGSLETPSRPDVLPQQRLTAP